VRRCNGNRQLGRTRRRWENNIEMDHEEMGQKGVKWIQLVYTAMTLRVPRKGGIS
jgi:ribosomal protein L28